MARFIDWLVSLRGALWLNWSVSFCPIQFCGTCEFAFWTWRPWATSFCSLECELAEVEALEEEESDDDGWW